MHLYIKYRNFCWQDQKKGDIFQLVMLNKVNFMPFDDLKINRQGILLV